MIKNIFLYCNEIAKWYDKYQKNKFEVI